MDGADVCRTSSRASRRPPDVICGVAILDPRWRRWKWRHPGPGARFSTPIEVEVENGGPSASGRHLGWPHLRETGNEVIQDGDRKRKGRHFPPPPQWGSKNAPYTTHQRPRQVYIARSVTDVDHKPRMHLNQPQRWIPHHVTSASWAIIGNEATFTALAKLLTKMLIFTELRDTRNLNYHDK